MERFIPGSRAFLVAPVILAAALLGGCAETAAAPEANSSLSPAIISTPGNPDNPPVTMSGYMDTSATVQGR
jgi:hypothetical protein